MGDTEPGKFAVDLLSNIIRCFDHGQYVADKRRVHERLLQEKVNANMELKEQDELDDDAVDRDAPFRTYCDRHRLGGLAKVVVI